MLDIYNIVYDLICLNSSVLTCDLMVAQKRGRNMSLPKIKLNKIIQDTVFLTYIKFFFRREVYRVFDFGMCRRLFEKK
jgi:hypothetical protein